MKDPQTKYNRLNETVLLSTQKTGKKMHKILHKI